jgi:hypothetical protein
MSSAIMMMLGTNDGSGDDSDPEVHLVPSHLADAATLAREDRAKNEAERLANELREVALHHNREFADPNEADAATLPDDLKARLEFEFEKEDKEGLFIDYRLQVQPITIHHTYIYVPHYCTTPNFLVSYHCPMNRVMKECIQ